MKKIDLGELRGDIVIFGGVYSNLHALEALINYTTNCGIPPENVICTGDVVAYCAYAEGSVKLIREFGCHVLAGNCEQQLASKSNDCGCGFDEESMCSILSRSWYAHAKSQVSEISIDWMSNLPERIIFNHNGLKYGVIHGGASDISKFIWPVDSEEILNEEFDLLQSQIGKLDCLVAGHTGIPMIRDFNKKKWLNSGAIGMPSNDGEIDTTFLTISKRIIKINRLEYDINAAYQAMQATSLIQGYHNTLKTGYWPSQDTLPVSMRV
ncbi:MAG: metallophosphoesterase family protein [Amylibacter sp.]|jgi:predicted phosphodiesterase|nr:metallophosphatase family protein [Amylibacter sp.]